MVRLDWDRLRGRRAEERGLKGSTYLHARRGERKNTGFCQGTFSGKGNFQERAGPERELIEGRRHRVITPLGEL